MDIERMKKYMVEHDLDAVGAMDPLTVAYLVNCYVRGLMVANSDFKANTIFPVFPLKSESFVIDFPRIVYDPPPEARPSWIEEYYVGSGGGFAGPEVNVNKLAEVLTQKGLHRGRIGLDMDFVPVNMLRLLESVLPEAQFVNAQTLFKQMRAVKTDKEVGFLRRSIEIAETGFYAVLKEWKAGRTTDDLFQTYATTIVGLGSHHIGSNFTQIYRDWFETPVKRRDMRFGTWELRENDDTAVKFDFGASWEGYHSDMNRRIYLGTPPREWIERVEADAHVCDVVIAAIRPGMSAREVHAMGKEALVREFGPEILNQPPGEEFTFMHSIGLQTHEEPIVAFAEPEEVHDRELVYEVNTVFDLEPTWIEDMFIVTEDGVKRMTTLPRRLFTV